MINQKLSMHTCGQGFTTSALLTLGVRYFFVHCSHIPGLYPLDVYNACVCTHKHTIVVTTKNVSRHCQMYSCSQNLPRLRITDVVPVWKNGSLYLSTNGNMYFWCIQVFWGLVCIKPSLIMKRIFFAMPMAK